MKKITVDPGVQGLIFDADGTLGDSMRLHYEAWSATRRSFGMEFTQALFFKLAGLPAPKIVVMLLQEYGLSHDPFKIAEEKDDGYAK